MVENPRPYLRTYELEDNNNSPSPQTNPSSEVKKVESVLNAETYLSDALNKQINKTDIDGNNAINGEYEYEYHYNNITDSLSRFSENTKHRSIQASIITSVLVVLIFLGNIAKIRQLNFTAKLINNKFNKKKTLIVHSLNFNY